MNTAHLPSGTLLDNTNFVAWKARVDAALCALGLPSIDAERPQDASAEEWQALSGLAANIIHNVVPPDLLKQVSAGHYRDHAKLVQDLESLTLPFRFMDLPPELRNRIYDYLIPMHKTIKYMPLKGTATGFPPIVQVSRQIRAESLPIAYERCTFMLDFEAPDDAEYEEGIAAEQAVHVPTSARKCARKLSGPLKRQIRSVRVRIRVQNETEGLQSDLLGFGFNFALDQGIESYYPATDEHLQDDECLTGWSQILIIARAMKIEEERQLLHLQGEALIMALTRDDEIWKYGKLKCW